MGLGALGPGGGALRGFDTPAVTRRHPGARWGALLLAAALSVVCEHGRARARPKAATASAQDGEALAATRASRAAPERVAERERPPHDADGTRPSAAESGARKGRAAADSAPPAAALAPDGSPIMWQPSHGRECVHTGRLKNFCEGPRRVPLPHGPDAARAERLGMGERVAAAKLLFGPPPEAWVRAAANLPSEPGLLRPLDEIRVFRGLESWAEFKKNRKQSGPRGSRHKPHAGVDLGADEGTPIHAARSGVVVYSDNGVTGYGNLVMIVHADGSVALYGHCHATFVFAGQAVQRGDVIGEVGHTGYAQAPHLHFEYRVRGVPRDPLKLFDKR